MPAGGAHSTTGLTGDGLVAQRGLAAVIHHCQTVFESLREPQPAAGWAGPVHPDADWAAAQQRLTELSGAPNNQPFAAQAEKWVETAGRALRWAEQRNARPDPPTPATDGADRPAHTPPPAHTAPQDIDPAPPWVWSSLNLTARGATLQHGPFALRHGVGAYSVIIAGTGLAPVRLTEGTCVGVVSADAQRQWRPVPATELEAAEARKVTRCADCSGGANSGGNAWGKHRTPTTQSTRLRLPKGTNPRGHNSAAGLHGRGGGAAARREQHLSVAAGRLARAAVQGPQSARPQRAAADALTEDKGTAGRGRQAAGAAHGRVLPQRVLRAGVGSAEAGRHGLPVRSGL